MPKIESQYKSTIFETIPIEGVARLLGSLIGGLYGGGVPLDRIRDAVRFWSDNWETLSRELKSRL